MEVMEVVEVKKWWESGVGLVRMLLLLMMP